MNAKLLGGMIVALFAIIGVAVFYPYYTETDVCRAGSAYGSWESVTEELYFNDSFPRIARYFCDLETDISELDCLKQDKLVNAPGCKWGGKTSKRNANGAQTSLYVMVDPEVKSLSDLSELKGVEAGSVVQVWAGNATMEIVRNKCLSPFDCEAEFTVLPFVTKAISKDDIGLSYDKFEGGASNIEMFEEVCSKTPVYSHKTTCEPYSRSFIDGNGTEVTETISNCTSVKDKIASYSKSCELIETNGIDMEASVKKTYVVRGKVNKNSVVDWKISIGGFEPNWAWWNSSFTYRRNVYNKPGSNLAFIINGSSGFCGKHIWVNPTAQGNFSVYYNTCSDVTVANDDTVIPHEVEENGTGWNISGVYPKEAVGVWHFGGQDGAGALLDSTANNNDLFEVNGTPTHLIDSLWLGGSYNFSTGITNDVHVRMNSISGFMTTASGSVVGWLRAASATGVWATDAPFAFQDDSIAGTQFGYPSGSTSTDCRNPTLRNDRIEGITISAIANTKHFIATTNAAGAGGWNFYQNNISKSSQTGEATALVSTGNYVTTIGGNTGGSSTWDGQMYEVQVYNKTLTVAELTELKENTVDGVNMLLGNEETVPNISPVMTSDINETIVFGFTWVNASATYSDADLDTGTVYFNLTVNGTYVFQFSKTGVASGGSVSYIIDPANYSFSDNLSFKWKAYDGTDYGSNSTNITVSEYRPAPTVTMVLPAANINVLNGSSFSVQVNISTSNVNYDVTTFVAYPDPS